MTGRRDLGAVEGLLRPDGGVVVPAGLVRPLRAILAGYLADCARTDAAVPTPAVRRLMWALAAARPADTPPPSSATGTPTVAPATVEISTGEAARILGCSASYVRRLCRSGGVSARRAGRRAWLVDRVSLDAWRHGRKEPG